MKILTMTLIIVFSSTVSLFAIEKDNQPKNELVSYKEKLPNAPNVPKIEYPELPENVPNVKKLIHLSNHVIEMYNLGQLQNTHDSISKEWHEDIITKLVGTQNAKKINLDPDTNLLKGAAAQVSYAINTETEQHELKSIYIISARVPINEEGEHIGTKHAWFIFVAGFNDSKIDFTLSDIFEDSNDGPVVLKFSDDGMEFSSFSKDNDKPMPWVKWNQSEKIEDQGTKLHTAREIDVLFNQLFKVETKPSEAKVVGD